MFNHISRAVFAALAITAVVATPAMATPVAYDGSTYQYGDSKGYGFSSDDFVIDDSSASDAWNTAHPTYNSRTGGNWDGHGNLYVYDTENDQNVYFDGSNLDVQCTQDTDGSDYLFSCLDEELLPGLFVHPEYRALASTSSERLVWVFYNESNSEITFDASTYTTSECDSNGFAELSNGWSGEQVSDNVDVNASNWMVQREDDTRSAECAIETIAWQSAGAAVTSESTLNSDLDGLRNTFTLTIPAGGTQALMFFYASGWIDDQDEDSLDLSDPTHPYVAGRQAAFDAQLALVDSDMSALTDANTVGLDADLDIVNWEPAASENLAATGVDASGIALGALALLAVGGAVIIRRRARA